MAKTYRVALYFNLSLVHHQGMVNGMITYARARGDWELCGAYWPMAQIGDFRQWDGDGIIAAVETDEDIVMLTGAGVPVVDTSGAIIDPRLSLVTNDNPEIGRIGGEHLTDNGLEHFAFCAASGSCWSDERLAGFEEATAPYRSGRVSLFAREIAWWHSPEFSRELADFLTKQDKPLGVMAANDIVGMNVMGACRLAGLRVPEDVALVSVDNEVLLCELSTPPISSIPFDRHEIGLRSAERLDVLMQGMLPAMPELRVRPQPLVERASSSTIAVDDELVAEALAYIRQNAVNNLSAGEVARDLHVSRRNLERRFHAQMGRTILEEIHRVRIKRAKVLLRDRDVSTKQAAVLSGFRTIDRFTAIFTRYAGMLPGAYRSRAVRDE